jgi:anti-sigma regulatory factor (Ser/Thr protein kinase)
VVADIAIEGIEEAFEFDVAGMWLQGVPEGRLEPTAITDRGAELIENPPTYSAEGESISWEAFRTQTTRMIDRMNDHESRHNPETPVRSELIVPVGEYGVLNIGSTEPCAFDERDRHRVEVWGRTVEEALGRMEQLIEDVLELARQGATVGETQEVRLRQLVSRCWSSVETHDAELVVENLVRNAIEHGSTEATITVGGLDDEDGFYVADDGPGIPESEREAVFESGYSTDDSGSGLGLAIVEQTAEAHGWDVRVTESSEGGARFEVVDVDFTE